MCVGASSQLRVRADRKYASSAVRVHDGSEGLATRQSREFASGSRDSAFLLRGRCEGYHATVALDTRVVRNVWAPLCTNWEAADQIELDDWDVMGTAQTRPELESRPVSKGRPLTTHPSAHRNSLSAAVARSTRR